MPSIVTGAAAAGTMNDRSLICTGSPTNVIFVGSLNMINLGSVTSVMVYSVEASNNAGIIGTSIAFSFTSVFSSVIVGASIGMTDGLKVATEVGMGIADSIIDDTSVVEIEIRVACVVKSDAEIRNGNDGDDGANTILER